MILNRLSLLPPSLASGRIEFRPILGAYVGILSTLSCLIGLSTVRTPEDPVSVVVGAVLLGVIAFYAVSSVAAVPVAWSANVCVHLAIAFTLGPAGVAAGAFVEAGAMRLRTGQSLVKTAFNVSDCFLANMAAYSAFHALSGHAPTAIRLATAGIVGGVADLVVNYSLLAVVVLLTTTKFSVLVWMRYAAGLTPYSIGYGLAASGAVILYHAEGLLGLITMMSPVVLLQGFLVFLARSVAAHDREAMAHQMEREALLERAVVASDTERRRIAGELHDGVVQELVGMALTLSTAIADVDTMNEREREMAARLAGAADVSFLAARDLRTLIVEISPPTLRNEGLQAALVELLSKVERQGMAAHLEIPEVVGLSEVDSKLVYRVCQEAVRNAIKYSKARQVTVRIDCNPGHVVTTVSDDGQGFTAATRAKRRRDGHIGLSLLTQTAQDGGGELAISSTLAGTTIVLNLPRDAASAVDSAAIG